MRTQRRAAPGLYSQLLLDVHQELIVDLFAGGGGASLGIEMATGRQVDVAINHDAAAVALHQANHPQTRHRVCDVFEADPQEVTQGRPVGLLWASPDCTHHSKARGGKPLRDAARKRRALAWVVTRWAAQVKPRVIALENVEEFADWGPLVGPPDALRPCPRRKGRTFRKWVRSLRRLGYVVEWRELRACDFGAPTIRKRLFVIARCDGGPIVWPTPTHGPGTRRPYRSAAECIDWSTPMCSVFATREEAREWGRLHGQAAPKRPLADATMRRIARGVQRFVIEAAEPFIVGCGGRAGQSPERSLLEPYQTITAKGDAAVVAPVLVQTGYGERDGQAPRTLDLSEPLGTIVGGGQKHALAAAFLAKNFGGVVGSDLRDPKGTVTTIDHDSLVAASLTRTPAARAGQVAAFLAAYYGTEQGQGPADPLATITTHDRFGLVTVEVGGEPYVIADIAMRMLQPRELYRAQGFPDGYRIDVRFLDPVRRTVRRLTKTEQVRMVGNSVSPQVAAAIVAANVPEMIVRDEVLSRTA